MKVFFDNNLSIHLARSVAAASIPQRVEVMHLRERFEPTATDEEWLGALSKEGGWSIISGDRRIQTRSAERAAWRQAGLTTFFLASKSWHRARFWEVTWRFYRWWPVIMNQIQAIEAGAAFEVPFTFNRGRLKQLPV